MTKHSRLLFVAAIWLLTTGSVSSAADNPAEVIQQAIDALGGKEAILAASELRTVGKTNAVTVIDNKRVEFNCLVETWQSPEHHMMSVFATFPNNVTVSDVEVVHRGKAWYTSEGRITPLTAEQVEVKNFEHYLRRLRTLVPLQDKTQFEIQAIPSAKFEGRELRGVLVRPKDESAPKHKPPVKLYFDHESHLLTKIEAEILGNPIEKVLGDYRQIGKQGMKHAHSLKHYVKQELRAEETITQIELIK